MASMYVKSYLILLSRFVKNFPRMLIAITLKPLSASISRTVNTVSYSIEFPTFFVESVFVATYIIRIVQLRKRTCARMSFIVSLAAASPLPSSRNSRSTFVCKNGSVMPPTSCSGLKPVVARDLRCLTSSPVAWIW